jgi:hypothetical protein
MAGNTAGNQILCSVSRLKVDIRMASLAFVRSKEVLFSIKLFPTRIIYHCQKLDFMMISS